MPTALASGTKIGTVTISMLTWSMKQPRNSRMRIMPSRIASGARSNCPMSRISPPVAPLNDRIWLKVWEAAMMNRIMTEIFTVPAKAAMSPCQSATGRRPRAARAATQPSAADSVGVARPLSSEPMTTAKSPDSGTT
jgi:hypothetical protein